MSASKLGIPDRPAKEITTADHPEKCGKWCTLYRYPKQCKKASCPLERERKAPK